MYKYAIIKDTAKGLCTVGDESNEKFYKSIGMELLDVQQSDVDGLWYLIDKCPMKTNEQKARLIKNDLIENVNYNLKSNVAYTGVRFDYGDIELVFETNKDSMSLINFTLTSILTGAMTEVKNWKCRKTTEPYEPLSVDFTIEQFRQIVAFALNMVNSAFNIEKQINEQIEQLSTLQLNNEEYIETFKTQMQQAYNQIPVKIEGLFEAATPTETPTEEPETQPTEEPETT